jgi:hypothetical protein
MVIAIPTGTNVLPPVKSRGFIVLVRHRWQARQSAWTVAGSVGSQFESMDDDAGTLRAEDKESVRLRFFRLGTREKCLDPARRQFLGADAVIFGRRGQCAVPLPEELDGNRLSIVRDPDAVDAGEDQGVVTIGGDGADAVLFMREYDCFEGGSVGIGDGHEVIVAISPGANQSWVVQAGHRANRTVS